MLNLTFLKPTNEHLNLILDLERSNFNNAFNAEWIKKILLNKGLVIVAKYKNSFAGHAIASISLDQADIISIIIEKKLRRKGLGQMLMLQLLKKLGKRKVTKVYLEVSVENKLALRLYSRIGFKSVGYRLSYFKNKYKSTDAEIMCLDTN